MPTPAAPLDQPEPLELVHGLADGEAVDGVILGEGQLRELVSRRVDADRMRRLSSSATCVPSLGSRSGSSRFFGVTPTIRGRS